MCDSVYVSFGNLMCMYVECSDCQPDYVPCFVYAKDGTKELWHMAVPNERSVKSPLKRPTPVYSDGSTASGKRVVAPSPVKSSSSRSGSSRSHGVSFYWIIDHVIAFLSPDVWVLICSVSLTGSPASSW